VAAGSFARIFFRNSINVGLPLIECDTSGIKNGDQLEVDFGAGKLVNVARGETISFKPLPKIMLDIINEGGLVPYFQKYGNFRL